MHHFFFRYLKNITAQAIVILLYNIYTKACVGIFTFLKVGRRIIAVIILSQRLRKINVIIFLILFFTNKYKKHQSIFFG